MHPYELDHIDEMLSGLSRPHMPLSQPAPPGRPSNRPSHDLAVGALLLRSLRFREATLELEIGSCDSVSHISTLFNCQRARSRAAFRPHWRLGTGDSTLKSPVSNLPAMESTGLEPATPSLQSWCSPN
jgi:hypothetical protein